MTILNARRAALRMFSGKSIYNRAMPGGLRTARHCVFTGVVVAANGICSAAFCESAVQREAGLTPQTLWQNRKVSRTAKASPFGRGGCDQWEQTERASPLAGEKAHTLFMTEL